MRLSPRPAAQSDPMLVFTVTAILLLVIVPAPARSEDEPSSLVAFAPKAAGMMETVAGYMLGQSQVTFHPAEDGKRVNFGLKILAPACPSPDAPAEERAAFETGEKQRHVERVRLAHEIGHLADQDGSGEVSDSESATFRMTVESVLLAQWLAEHEGQAPTCERLAAAIGRENVATRDLLQRYTEMQPALYALSPRRLYSTEFRPLEEMGLGLLLTAE